MTKKRGEILQRFKREYQRLNGEIGVMDLECILNDAKKIFEKAFKNDKNNFTCYESYRRFLELFGE